MVSEWACMGEASENGDEYTSLVKQRKVVLMKTMARYLSGFPAHSKTISTTWC